MSASAPTLKQRRTLTMDDWQAEGREKFGDDPKGWRFECPSCHEVQTLGEFIDAEIADPDTLFFFSCIGRWVDGRGCDWTLGGLLTIHKTEVIGTEGKPVPVMEWAT